MYRFAGPEFLMRMVPSTAMTTRRIGASIHLALTAFE